MKPPQTLTHKFVEFVPEELEQGILYVSIRYVTAVHKCCCGCGYEVVTPLSPNDWKLIFDGKTVSLEPSIGNWGFACRSHYWITRNQVSWAEDWSDKRVEASRKFWKENRNAGSETHDVSQRRPSVEQNTPSIPEKEGLLKKLTRKVKGTKKKAAKNPTH
jgi:hypothetical protein